jgi:fatty-acyl-CoA synthase
MNHAEDRFLIVEDVLLDVWQQVKSRVKCERVFVVDHGGRLPEGTESYEAFLQEAGDDPQYRLLEEVDAAAMCYTSGTTGRPKGVVYSHRAIVLHSFACSLPDHFNISRRDTVLPVVSMYHVNAWGLPYSAVLNGSKQVLPGRNLQPQALLDLMQDEQVTLTAGVPTIWMGVLDALEKSPGHWNL